jgi:coenzyme PQQ biosynthesis protein C
MNECVRKLKSAGDMVEAPWSPEEFEAHIRAVGTERYHDKHEFHRLLHGGKLSKGQVAAWALNRYCYQEAIPRKDAAFMSRVHDRDLRREWIHRIHDHDGQLPEEHGGIERWLQLTDCLGLDREYVTSMSGALPAIRFAVEAYVTYVREQPLPVAAASSLTELFAPSIHRERIAGMLASYSFVNDDVMAYFKRRLNQAPRDATYTLQFVKDTARTREMQQACVAAVLFKCDVLWAQLDALHLAYVHGMVPPGAYLIGEN